MNSEILKNTDFYLEFSKWIDAHEFNEEGQPIDENGDVIRYSLHENYPVIRITNNYGKCKPVRIHRMVAYLFIPNPSNLCFVNHKNGDRGDFRVSNLEWATQREIVNHAIKIGKSKPRNKAIIAISKNTNETLEFPSMKSCAEYFGVTTVFVRSCIYHGYRMKRLWNIQFKNQHDNDRIEPSLFEDLVRNGKIKEHPIFKGYYGYLEKAQIISRQTKIPRILKTLRLPSDYCRIYIGGYKKATFVHRFLMECNIGRSLMQTEEIDHIDANPSNNVITNLQILSRKENLIKANAKTVIIEFDDERKLKFDSLESCGEYFGVCAHTISDWCYNKNKGYKNRQIRTVYYS